MCRVSSEEIRDEIVVWRAPLLMLTVTIICRERNSPRCYARSYLAAVLGGQLPGLLGYSNPKMRPFSKLISGARHVWLWSNQSGSGSLGFRGRLNQSSSGSSSEIHSLIACQGGSIGSIVSLFWNRGRSGGRFVFPWAGGGQ
jgi:hypothetical protein